jgi:hypothetical protein
MCLWMKGLFAMSKGEKIERVGIFCRTIEYQRPL